MSQERAEKRIDELPVLSEVTGTEELPISDNGVAKKVSVETLLAGVKTGQSLTEEIKTALLTIAQKVAYIDEHGQTYYDALYNALYPPATLLSITAVFTQGDNVVYDTDSLDTLKQYLVVTAHYDDNTDTVVSDYTLSGTLAEGTSTITVSFGGKTTAFTVSVTHIAALTSITASFAQGNRTIFSNESLNGLKQWLTVTANYDNGTTETVPSSDYSLSGTLEDGTSTVTASYNGKTANFAVAVTGYEIPAGYDAYDYIQKKNVTEQSIPKDSFICLNDQADLNELSLETKIAIKGTKQHAPALFGIRNTSDWLTSYSVYCNKTQGIAGALRGTAWETGYFLNQTPTVFEIINPSASPAYWRINGGELHEIPWETTFAIPHGFSILHSIPYNLTGTQALNIYARIGYIILRKADGECVGYYVPTVYDGKIGMYDIVSKQFYTAATASVVTISDSGCLYSVGNWT